MSSFSLAFLCVWVSLQLFPRLLKYLLNCRIMSCNPLSCSFSVLKNIIKTILESVARPRTLTRTSKTDDICYYLSLSLFANIEALTALLPAKNAKSTMSLLSIPFTYQLIAKCPLQIVKKICKITTRFNLAEMYLKVVFVNPLIPNRS